MFHNGYLAPDTCDIEQMSISGNNPNGEPIRVYTNIGTDITCRFIDKALMVPDPKLGYVLSNEISMILPAQYKTLKPRDRITNVSIRGKTPTTDVYIIESVTPRKTLLQDNVMVMLTRDHP